jgi:hypothetical protein
MLYGFYNTILSENLDMLLVQGDQRFSVHLMITAQKTAKVF